MFRSFKAFGRNCQELQKIGLRHNNMDRGYKCSVNREGTICVYHSEFPASTSASSVATASDIVLRLAGSPFQHPSIISHTELESWEWSGRAGRRPFNIE